MQKISQTAPANLENCILKENAQPTVQTHTVHNCKVTSVFSNTADPGIRRDVAQMLLAAFQSNLKRSAKNETRIVSVQSQHEETIGSFIG